MFGGLHGKRVCPEHKTWTCGCRGTDVGERPADKAALEEWITTARRQQAELDLTSFDQRRRWIELEDELNEYLEELFIVLMRGEMDAELA